MECVANATPCTFSMYFNKQYVPANTVYLAIKSESVCPTRIDFKSTAPLS